VMLASSVLLIPWERADNKHPLAQERGSGLTLSLKAMARQNWTDAAFWGGAYSGDWRFSRIMGDPNEVTHWTDEQGRPSFSNDANTIAKRKVGDVFRVLRNALAHGNLLYLDKNGHETPGNRVQHLAFLSRYEETEEHRKEAETYRLVTVQETDFLPFVRYWAEWVTSHHAEERNLRVA
jgi:hypothetical protein